MVYTLC